MNSINPISNIIGGIVLAVCLLAGAFFLPWQNINWGKVEYTSPQTTTVIGTAETQEKSQIASFNAGVSAVKDNKQEAVSEVNNKVTDLIKSFKDFGISEKDIKTQNLSIHQEQESYYEEGRQKSRPGQWRISNSVEIILRNVDRASKLTELLASGGATNVYGPNFSFDDTSQAEESLLEAAVENAREKAEIIAKASGRNLGKILSVSEGYQPQATFRAYGEMGGGGGLPTEPGTGTVSKTVTAVFEFE